MSSSDAIPTSQPRRAGPPDPADRRPPPDRADRRGGLGSPRRPDEAIGLRWHDLGERTLLIERSVAFGQFKPTKTASTRSVRLLAPLKEDLLNRRAHTSRDKDLDLIFPSPDGSPWNHDRARNWRKREFAEAAGPEPLAAAHHNLPRQSPPLARPAAPLPKTWLPNPPAS